MKLELDCEVALLERLVEVELGPIEAFVGVVAALEYALAVEAAGT